MTRTSGYYIGIIALGLVLLYLIIRALQGDLWVETYRHDESEPYDLDIFVELLERSSPSATSYLDESIAAFDSGDSAVCLVFLGRDFIATPEESKELLDFIEAGNSAFICASSITLPLLQEISANNTGPYQTIAEDTRVDAYIGNDTTRYTFEYRDDKGPTQRFWSYFTIQENESYKKEVLGEYVPEAPSWYSLTDYFDEIDEYDEEYYDEEYDDDEDYYDEDNDDFEGIDKYTVPVKPTTEDSIFIQFNEDGKRVLENFISFNIGEGKLFLHSDQLFFTNYFIIENEGFEYAQKVISHLPNKRVVWDRYHANYHYEGEFADGPPSSPLRFVFENPPLKYAWYTIILTTLLFVLFRSKRQQRIIPLMPRVENTSIAFAHSLGALHYKADSGRHLAKEMMHLFNNFNRRRYGIKRKKDISGLAEEIAKKSKTPIELVKSILELERKIVFNPSSRMSENGILYRKLQSYYKQARK